jgi:predicted RNase H-like HicB family nuclease
MAQYIGILDGSKDVWGVRIPDVPGCHGGGATPEAAIADAISALREFAAHQQTKGIVLKAPRTVHEVIRDKEAEFDPGAGEAIVMVPLILDQARPVKANISLDAGLLDAIDEEAKRRGLTRSAFITSAALDKIQLKTINATTRGSGMPPVNYATSADGDTERTLTNKGEKVQRKRASHREGEPPIKSSSRLAGKRLRGKATHVRPISGAQRRKWTT